MSEYEAKLLDVLCEMASELPPSVLDALGARLGAMDGNVVKGDLAPLGATPRSRRHLERLEHVLGGKVAPSGTAIALALQAVLHATRVLKASTQLEIAWTGPGTEAVPVRRVDQVMYELIEQSKSLVVLSSFVTHGAATALSALHAATQRGVEVIMVLEKADETSGKLEFDGLAQVENKVPGAEIYYWPMEKRRVGSSGKRGILHAKCLVCDEESALVSSANLTDQGLELNLELGLVLRGGDVPRRLSKHLRQLIHQGDLVALR